MNEQDYQKNLRKFLFWIATAVIVAILGGFTAFSTFVGKTSVDNTIQINKLESESSHNTMELSILKQQMETKMDKAEFTRVNEKIIADMDSLKRLQLYILMNLKKMK